MDAILELGSACDFHRFADGADDEQQDDACSMDHRLSVLLCHWPLATGLVE